jgi:hypothetical protein
VILVGKENVAPGTLLTIVDQSAAPAPTGEGAGSR